MNQEISLHIQSTPTNLDRCNNLGYREWSYELPSGSKCILLLLKICSYWYISVTRFMISRYVDSQISTQLRASALSLLELLFIRESAFSCSFLSSSEIDQLVDLICTAWVADYFFFSFFHHHHHQRISSRRKSYKNFRAAIWYFFVHVVMVVALCERLLFSFLYFMYDYIINK